jgi:hypothetical protein
MRLPPTETSPSVRQRRISIFCNPAIAVPIGRLPYNSTITIHTEYLSVTISFMTQIECDYIYQLRSSDNLKVSVYSKQSRLEG